MARETDETKQEGGALLTVTELASALGVTPRAIRLYESKGLITPARAGSNRVYGRRDQARMKLILRGKRLGFSLRDIKTFLDLYDADPTHRTQLERVVEAVRERRRKLEEQQTALTQTLRDLQELEQQALDALESAPAKARRAG
jgi:DNA-binding transcriptional MerR regulator